MSRIGMKRSIVMVLAAAIAFATLSFMSGPASAAGPGLPAGSYDTSMSVMLTGNKIVYRDCLAVDSNFMATPCKSSGKIGKFAVRHNKLVFSAKKGHKIVAGGFDYCAGMSCVLFPAWNTKTPLPVTQEFGGIRYHLTSAHVELKR